MFDEVERMVVSGDVDKADRALSEMRERFPRTIYAQQAGLLVAKLAADTGKVDSAKTALTWVADHATDRAYSAVARLRLSGLLIEGKAYDDAMKVLNVEMPVEFSGLVADRKADIYLLQGKKSDAIADYQKAYKLLDERSEYRRLVEVKLGALGVSPEAVK